MIKAVGLFVVSLVVLAACGPAATPEAGPNSEQATRAQGPKQLTVAIAGEPQVVFSSMGLGNQPNLGGDIQGALHQKLATLDDRGESHAQLAVELPSQQAGSWIVRPDGTMQTTYRLRPDVTWHDGARLTARDFIFGYVMTTDPDLPVGRARVAQHIERIEAPDDSTLLIEWKQTFPFANAITDDDLGPLPAHLIESEYRADKERFIQLPYWTTEFVGVGPYRMGEWVLGSHMALEAYDGFYSGRPKIDTIIVRFISDGQTAVAGVLSGALDGAIPATVDFQQATFIQQEWERQGKKGSAIPQSVHWRTMAFQFRSEMANPRDILDVRVRRALLHGIDRQSIVDVLFNGVAPISHVFMPPDDFRWDWIKDAVVRYEHDPRRAQTLLSESGWQRTADGGWITTTGDRAAMTEWSSPGYEQEITIIADNWKAIGIPTDIVVLSPGEARDRQKVASFPSVQTTTFPIAFQFWMQRHHGEGCSREANRWVGWNRGCYMNAERDRVADQLSVTIDPAQQRPLYRELARIESEDLPALPLYFNVQITIVREGVVGVKRNTNPKTTAMWNVTEWDIVR